MLVKIILFLFTSSSVVATGLEFSHYDEIQKHLKQMSGKTSVVFKQLKSVPEINYNGDDKFALGSVFKLYILSTLMNKVKSGEISWSQKFPIRESLKSLPNGNMQHLANNTQVSLLHFASKMISISDNTATDHLLDIVGRNEVEKLMNNIEINSFPRSNIPFLSTMDFFKIRLFFNESKVRKYLKVDRSQRLNLIQQTPFSTRKDLLSRITTWTSPRFIEKIQWYASPRNICSLYQKLDDSSDAKFRSIMNIRTPFIDIKKSKRWVYAGYKGGSEPGVLNMAYLLEDIQGTRYCLFIGQNDKKNPIKEIEFTRLVKGIFHFLEKQNI